jgi:Uncharacterised BCR, YnfA/UPF0060 family
VASSPAEATVTGDLADQRNRPATGKINGMAITRAVALFFAAGLAETGGGYLIWRWLREAAPVIAGVLGAIIMGADAIIPELQKGDDFSRISQPTAGCGFPLVAWTHRLKGGGRWQRRTGSSIRTSGRARSG